MRNHRFEDKSEQLASVVQQLADVVNLREKRESDLFEMTNTLLPWWSSDFNSHNNILRQTVEDTEAILDGYYLYPIKEINVPEEIDDIPKFINQRFQTLYSAAANSDASVMLVVQSKGGKTTLYMGFKSIKQNSLSEHLFSSLLNGIIPGKKFLFNETEKISKLTEGFKFGGVVSGVPAIKIDNDVQRIKLSSVIRSLYGQDYTLSILSTPLSNIEKQQALAELINYRDKLHALANQTLSNEKGSSDSTGKTTTNTVGESTSKTKGKSESKSRNHSFGIIIYNYSRGKTYTDTESTTESTNNSESNSDSTTITSSTSSSISFEKQNGMALELKNIANQYIERLIKGFNAGYWDTTVTFAAKERIATEVLGSAFLGELSKPNENLLPPPRMYLGDLGEKQNLFLPLKSSSNKIFPKAIASYLTSEELSWLGSVPTESIPGFEIKKMPSLALTDLNQGEYKLGHISDNGNPIDNSYITLSKKDLNKHLFVCGLTGSGKTTTVKQILKNISKEEIPFLVIESAKKDYRQLLADDVFKKMRVFTIGDAAVSPIRFNPFYIQGGVHPLVHIDFLKAIFNASFSLYGPMPHIIEKCLHRVYIKKGWNLTTGLHPHFTNNNGELDTKKFSGNERNYFYPSLMDLKKEVELYMKEKDYQGELKDNIKTAILVRLESLTVGSKGYMFNTHDFFSIEDLLSLPTIFEMENLADDDDKAFFVGLMLVLISEYRQKDNPTIKPGSRALSLQHFLVIEEAHRLLKNVDTERSNEMMGNPKGKAVELFCNVIAEMRSLGQGVAVVEQIPTKISPDVIKNTNMKIVHRLVSRDDQSVLAGSLGLNDDEARYLNRLNTGFALCHKEGMDKPVESSIVFDVKSSAISDSKITRIMSEYNSKFHSSSEAYEFSEILGDKGTGIVVQFLNTLSVIDQTKDKLLLERTIESITKQLKMNEYKHKIDEKVVLSFIKLEIMLLLTRGTYCVDYKLPDGFVEQLSYSLNSKEIDFTEIRKLLKKIWKVDNAEEYIIGVVKNLLLLNRRITERSITDSDINKCFVDGMELNISGTVFRIKNLF